MAGSASQVLGVGLTDLAKIVGAIAGIGVVVVVVASLAIPGPAGGDGAAVQAPPPPVDNAPPPPGDHAPPPEMADPALREALQDVPPDLLLGSRRPLDVIETLRVEDSHIVVFTREDLDRIATFRLCELVAGEATNLDQGQSGLLLDVEVMNPTSAPATCSI